MLISGTVPWRHLHHECTTARRNIRVPARALHLSAPHYEPLWHTSLCVVAARPSRLNQPTPRWYLASDSPICSSRISETQRRRTAVWSLLPGDLPGGETEPERWRPPKGMVTLAR